MAKIFRTEGFAGLYAGLSPTLVMSVPSTVLYFTMYDELRLRVGALGVGDGYAPAISGAASRTLAATAIAPLELVRTQLQATPESASRTILEQMRLNVSHHGVLSLWRGVAPTLWRDVPFSAAYWWGYEACRGAMGGPEDPPRVVFAKSFAAGAVSGLAASFLTHPFDVVKTRAQVLAYSGEEVPFPAAAGGCGAQRSSLRLLVDIVREEGFQGLYTGVIPRLAKVAPACAIMISSYEAGKLVFGRIRQQRRPGPHLSESTSE